MLSLNITIINIVIIMMLLIQCCGDGKNTFHVHRVFLMIGFTHTRLHKGFIKEPFTCPTLPFS